MRDFGNVKRVVVKIGSSSVVTKDLKPNTENILAIISGFKKLKDEGIDCALVSSGAIATGMGELGLNKKPKDMALKQACAAVGQAKLMEAYNRVAELYGIHLGQILISHDDFQVRKRMLVLSETLDAMFKNNIVPIINENDAVSVEEIKVGDNDTLSSLISPMVGADLLVLFSDIDGLYDKNPKIYPDAKMISTVDKIDETILAMVGDTTTNVGTGGMKTKIDAAISATTSGVDMIICNSDRLRDLEEIVKGDEIGTLFIKDDKVFSNRDNWIIFKSNALGNIVADSGLEKALKDKKVSILPKGIKNVNGEFLAGSVINVINADGIVLAKGITNYSSAEIKLVMGADSNKMAEILGFAGKKQIIHANDLVVVGDDYYGRFVK
ncbi:MAG: glutamate 5-kinase [Acholeplasmatales bacterium]|nr:glutamate 5-kinase [Acholeplasmatales bacterium]